MGKILSFKWPQGILTMAVKSSKSYSFLEGKIYFVIMHYKLKMNTKDKNIHKYRNK